MDRDAREPLGHPSVPVLCLLDQNSAVLNFSSEATLDYFSSVVEGLSRFGSPKGPKREPSLNVADPLDQWSGLSREALSEGGDIDWVCFHCLKAGRKPYEETVILFFDRL